MAKEESLRTVLTLTGTVTDVSSASMCSPSDCGFVDKRNYVLHGKADEGHCKSILCWSEGSPLSYDKPFLSGRQWPHPQDTGDHWMLSFVWKGCESCTLDFAVTRSLYAHDILDCCVKQSLKNQCQSALKLFWCHVADNLIRTFIFCFIMY